MERQKIIDELAEIEVKIADLEDILANHQRILDIIIEEVEAIQDKFGDERRTQIENVSGEVDIEDLIPVEESVVTYTNAGYIKRMPVSEYKAQKRGGRGVTGMKQREDDYIDELQTCSSHDNILFISNKGIMYKLKCYELPEGSKASRGTNIVNLLELGEGEKIAAMIKTADFDEGKYIVMVTKNGKIKRTPLTSYRNVRKNGLIAIGLDEGDEIAGVRMTFGDNEVIVATHNGYAIRIRETDIREMSRVAHGVKAIKLRGSDYVVSMARVREGASVLTVAENGLGRRVPLESYKVQNRGGYGLMNYKSGGVCGIKVVDDEDDIIMISTDGIVIRIRACDISMMSRYSRGVRLMRVGEDGRVVSFTRTEHDMKRWKQESIRDLKGYVDTLSREREVVANTLGDLVFDSMNLYGEYAASFDGIKMTTFQCIGNHDFDKRYQDLHNMALGTPVYGEQYYHRFFGPVNYSYNIGKVHVVTLKNINYVGHKKYIEAITDADLDWLKHDLSFVPKGSLVFLNMHAAVWNSIEGEGNVRNAEELADALKDYQVHVLTGHTHYFQNNVMDAQLLEHNIGAACGAWWKSQVNRCGAPNGYLVMDVDGNQLKWHYKSTGHSIDYQMRVYGKGDMLTRNLASESQLTSFRKSS
jgi:hypothetical protein